jgi:hypothetical protein
MKGKPFQRIAGILKNVAPTLLEMAGPGGSLIAGIARKAMGDETMTDETLEERVAAATQTTEGLAQLKQIQADLDKAELDYNFKFAELYVEAESVAAADRANARQMATSQTTILTPQNILAALFIVGYLTMMGLYFSESLVIPMDDTFKTLVGVLTAGVMLILNFYFGSTVGSQTKTALLSQAKGASS